MSAADGTEVPVEAEPAPPAVLVTSSRGRSSSKDRISVDSAKVRTPYTNIPLVIVVLV